jgi:hypothetical protein
METIERISLALGTPEHGWLPFRLQLNDFVLEDKASNVLTAPLTDLIEAVAFCHPPLVGSHRFCLWLEPEGYAVDLVAGASPDRCIVRVSFDKNFVPPMRGFPMEVVFEGEADAGVIRGALESALTEFFAVVDAPTLKMWKRLDEPDYAERLAELGIGGRK